MGEVLYNPSSFLLLLSLSLSLSLSCKMRFFDWILLGFHCGEGFYGKRKRKREWICEVERSGRKQLEITCKILSQLLCYLIATSANIQEGVWCKMVGSNPDGRVDLEINLVNFAIEWNLIESITMSFEDYWSEKGGRRRNYGQGGERKEGKEGKELQLQPRSIKKKKEEEERRTKNKEQGKKKKNLLNPIPIRYSWTSSRKDGIENLKENFSSQVWQCTFFLELQNVFS